MTSFRPAQSSNTPNPPSLSPEKEVFKDPLSPSPPAKKENALTRYGRITKKNPREIVLLRGTGCKWKKCRFCDYHLDCSEDEGANFTLNRTVLSKVDGTYGRLEVINSGSFTDLDQDTVKLIKEICLKKQIRTLHIESHWMHRHDLPKVRGFFGRDGITVKIKTGVETFDVLFRRSYLDKGLGAAAPAQIAAYFDEVCLLFGLPGQSITSMWTDIETGLSNFERVCVNVYCENTSPILPDERVITDFTKKLMPVYLYNPRVDILLQNTDFGVGGETLEK